MKYQKAILKLSGEALLGEDLSTIDHGKLAFFSEEISKAATLGVSLGIVIGGGNIFRGAQTSGLGVPRVRGDYMGMLATVINGLALQSALEQCGVVARMMSSIAIKPICELYTPERAKAHWNKGHIVILTGGLGQAYFTTDSAASLRALEMGAEVILKGTKVDGIYTDDPIKNPSAVRLDHLSFQEAYEQKLRIMDMTAFTLCEEQRLPIVVFNAHTPGHLFRLLQGATIGTLVS